MTSQIKRGGGLSVKKNFILKLKKEDKILMMSTVETNDYINVFIFCIRTQRLNQRDLTVCH